MDLIDKYIERKFSFFPLRPRSKRPSYSWEKWQHNKPSSEEIESWRKAQKLSQVAIVCGAVSGIIVLDVDNPETFDTWITEHKHALPPSPTVKTAHGRHIYFKHPGGKVKNSTKRIPGADLKADGGYVVAPPSIHPEGPAYEWFDFLGLDDVDPADPPAWLTEYFEREVSSKVELSQTDLLGEDEDDYTRYLRGVNKGERNSVAAKLAGYYLAKGEPRGRVLEMLRSWNLRNPEPLPDKEIQRTVDSVNRLEAKSRVRAGIGQGKEADDTSGLPWDEQRQAAMQGLGDLLGLPITDIRSTKTDNSIWELVLGDDGSVTVTGPQLISQNSFYSRMVSAAHLIPKTVPKSKNGAGGWKGVVKEIIRLSSHMEAGPEATAHGEVQGLINGFLADYRGVEYIPDNRKIPSNAAFFILHRDKQVCLYTRLDQIYLQSKYLGYKLTRRQLVSLLPGLGHEPDRFKWQGQTIRAWRLNLDSISTEIKEYVYRQAIERAESDGTSAAGDGTVTASKT